MISLLEQPLYYLVKLWSFELLYLVESFKESISADA